MSFPSNNNNDTVEDIVDEIKVEASPIGDIIDSLTALFYSIFPGLKTVAVQEELTIMELEENERYVPDVAVLTAKEAEKAIKKAEKSEDPFVTLSKELADDEDVDKKLKSLLER